MKLLLILLLAACTKTKAPTTTAKPSPVAPAPAEPAPPEPSSEPTDGKACSDEFCGAPKPCENPSGCV